ncbi:carboxymuconolactone decarboxylase family protein [Actinomyces sp. oral taxon 171]|uniref:carboxymuconolactone decarboxylase family protein n=1 Tax=Actinomyces sp. oral taxon 171 TaxID=706438 RepID=UPI0001F62161|nr:carboxymuconolactone decarboxylase family protein [Actinomyces sp. oral taxon 171]EFW27725.1 carboxymuconolactone decarboxylase family protein [Actinomyces sp. oral taxon 171 str. F0337]
MALTPQARETFTRLFGVEPQPHPTDPELFDILQNGIFDEAFSTGVLTDVERELLTITALTSMQTLPQLRAHVGAALNIGTSPLQLRETIYQCAPLHRLPQDPQRHRHRQRGLRGQRHLPAPGERRRRRRH